VCVKIVPVAEVYEHCSEPSGSIEAVEFLDQLNNIKFSRMVLFHEIAYKLINFLCQINRLGFVWHERLFGKKLNGLRRRTALSEDGVQ